MQPQRQTPEQAVLKEIEDFLLGNIIGQNEPIRLLKNSMAKMMADLNDPERPLFTALFMGPTGVGKTETVAALAQCLFGSRIHGMVRINCQEYNAHYNMSKLLGSPPGYVGGEVRPILDQDNLAEGYRWAFNHQFGLVSSDPTLDYMCRMADDEEEPINNEPISIVLFDEIEKAHPKIWNFLLGILEEGRVVLANNEISSFRKSIIIVTSNVGSRAIGHELDYDKMGFDIGISQSRLSANLAETALREAKRIFPIELINRFDARICFNPLSRVDCLKILNLMIQKFNARVQSRTVPFIVYVSKAAREHLLDIGIDRRFGARPIRRIVEEKLTIPISYLVCEGKVQMADVVVVDYNGSNLTYNSLSLNEVRNRGIMPVEGYREDMIIEPEGGRGKSLPVSFEEQGEDYTYRVSAKKQQGGN